MPPVDNTPHIDTGSFELVNFLHTFNKIPVYEYKSKRTGLNVIIAEAEGPVVNGFFTLVTETYDDDGLPHTLEHLIFLGSESYPYKGVLDLLANRCLASGTNAWTDVDYTCYTLDTAGSDGFLSLLPIYLEHILYPTLTDEGFQTEVYHITADGKDAGIVYCEMQGCENLAELRLHSAIKKNIYPGHCGYASITGGVMKNLRESTSNKKVCEYHKKYYRPENLKIIITGQIQHEELFKSLEILECRILKDKDSEQFVRPWQNPVPPFLESKDLIINYPSEGEKNGFYSIAWRGPNAVTEQYLLNAISIILSYFTEFNTCDLTKEFVEIDNPYASKVSFNVMENSISCIYITFHNVPLEKMSQIKMKLFDLFDKIIANENINMDRIQNLIKRNKLKCLNNMECDPAHTLACMIIGYVLYGNNKDDFNQRLNPISDYDKLNKESKLFWLDLIKKYFLNNKYVSIQCFPSKEEYLRLAEEEYVRVKQRIENFGVDGLKLMGEKLEKAIEINSRELPNEMLVSVPVPSLQSVKFFEIKRYRTDLDQRDEIDLSKTSVFTCFDNVKTEFVYIFAFLDTSALEPELRYYIPLYLECLFASPIKRNGQIISFEDVVEQLSIDTINNSASIGLGTSVILFQCGINFQTISIRLQVEPLKYKEGIAWLRDILYNIVFNVERLKIIATKMYNALSDVKRNGKSVALHAMNKLRFKNDSNIIANGVLKQTKFLETTLKQLNNEIEAQNIIDILIKMKKQLTKPNNIALHLFGNLDNLHQPELPLNTFTPEHIEPYQQKLHISPDYEFLKDNETMNACIIGVASVESITFFQTVNSINNYEHSDLPALMLCIQYFTQMEGPFWRAIRGKGFSYHYNLLIKPHEGLLYLTFQNCTNILNSYQEAKDIVQKLIENKNWDEHLIDSARSSLIFKIIDQEKTVGDVISLAVSTYLQNVDFLYNRKLLNLINKVTIDDLNRVGEKYLLPLFDPLKAKTSIVGNTTKINDIATGFKNFGIHLNIYSSLEESFLN